MSDPNPQLALREWRRHLSHPQTWIILVGIGVVVGLVGPFETEDHLRLFPRMLYWVVMAGLTYVTGYLVAALLEHPLASAPMWFRVGLSGLAMGVAIYGVVVLINAATFGIWPAPEEVPQLMGTVVAIAVVINVVLGLVVKDQTGPSQPAPAPTSPQAPPLLDRLPFDKRAPLVALSVEDHYTRVFTTTGEELLLMRLGDAIKETGETSGAQVHRSHWAALDQVVSAKRVGDRAILTMTTGIEIPVSRANLPKLKEAGLLPR